MKYFLSFLLLLFCTSVFAQEEADTKVQIRIKDTVEIYNRVKHALVNSEFIVKDNGNRDTLSTYTQEISGLFYRLTAVIENDIVTLSGVFGLKRIDDFGYTQNPKKYQNIIYYKGSKGWKLLLYVANLMGDDISFKK